MGLYVRAGWVLVLIMVRVVVGVLTLALIVVLAVEQKDAHLDARWSSARRRPTRILHVLSRFSLQNFYKSFLVLVVLETSPGPGTFEKCPALVCVGDSPKWTHFWGLSVSESDVFIINVLRGRPPFLHIRP